MLAPEPTFLLSFLKMRPTRSQVCRTAVIRNAPENPDLGAFNDGRNVEFRPPGTDLEVVKTPNNSYIIFSLDAQRSELSGAL